MAIVSLYGKQQGVPDRLEIGPAAHVGGEGTVYFTLDERYAVKIYHVQRASEKKRDLLEKVMLLGAALRDEEKQFLCWPLALVRQVDGATCVGCVTQRIPSPEYKPLVDIVLSPKEAGALFRAGKSWADFLQIARGIARSVSVLNGKGCTHSDLHFRNFYANQKTNEVVLLDLDGLVVPGFLPPQVEGITEFMAPEILEKRAKPGERSDRHSLAVLIMYTLLFRNVMRPLVTYDPDDVQKDEEIGFGEQACFSEHPSDRRNRPKWLGVPLFQQGCLSYRVLTRALQALTEKAFLDGLRTPDKRPTAREWANALNWAVDELWQCGTCGLHYPYPHWVKPPQRRACPFCGERVEGLPSVLLLYEPRSKGRYAFVGRYLVFGNGWKLFPDVIDPTRNPPLSRKGEQIIGHVEWDSKKGTHYLVNDEEAAWSARLQLNKSSVDLARGASVALQAGNIIYFGEGRRIIVVGE